MDEILFSLDIMKSGLNISGAVLKNFTLLQFVDKWPWVVSSIKISDFVGGAFVVTFTSMRFSPNSGISISFWIVKSLSRLSRTVMVFGRSLILFSTL